jgi:hypothetical protein
MIIRISATSHAIEIDDARNFKAFSVRIEGSFDESIASSSASRSGSCSGSRLP